ncbi:neuropeptide-like 1 isoform X3 [Cimex lectularius]|uniref:Neuropeptide-like 1 n=1 Tax=Cimex lectularius TaxID=79782 RepID=A0A8I6TCK4_CIMLE|nr:neuropeptide-like 1 isoform X3 [Cimex lectularius]
MFTTPLRIVLTAVLIAEAIGDGDEHHVEKRQANIIARMAHLQSYPRYYSNIAPKRDEKSSLDELAERLEEEEFAKRSGDIRVTGDLEEKRDELEGLVHDLASAEEMRRTRLEALREELFRERELEEEMPEEKRSFAALARVDALPKRILDDDNFSEDASDDKRGISSIARNGYYQKRMDDDLEQLMSEVYGIGEKRNVASLARGFSLPQGKRNIASIVRGKKDSFEETNEDKRNLPSIIRDRTEPLGEGKRHIGAFVANHGIPFVNDKRNVGVLAKNRDYPYALKFGKRDVDEEINKRHVATLLRQARLSDHPTETDDISLKETAQDDLKEEMSQITKDDMEHTRTKRMAREELEKRYFGVRVGKIPGGRLPKPSRSRNRHSSRRRY